MRLLVQKLQISIFVPTTWLPPNTSYFPWLNKIYKKMLLRPGLCPGSHWGIPQHSPAGLGGHFRGGAEEKNKKGMEIKEKQG